MRPTDSPGRVGSRGQGGYSTAPAGQFSPPANTVVPVIDNTAPAIGAVLSVTTGTWTGAPASFTYTYQWQRGTTNLGGATSSSYTVVAGDLGFTLRCRVTAANGVAPNGVVFTANTAAVVDLVTKLLVHFNNVATDDIAGITHNLHAEATYDTAKFGAAALGINGQHAGEGNFIDYDVATGLSLDPTLAWTLEGWGKVNSHRLIILLRTSGDVDVAYVGFSNLDGSRIYGAATTGGTIFDYASFIANSTAYHHIAITFNPTNGYAFYLDGVRQDTNASTTAISTPTKMVCRCNNAYEATGAKWDDVRVSQTERYTGASFTPPAAEFVVD